MDFIRNFPAIAILLCLFAGIITSGLKQKAARILNTVLICIELVLNGCTLFFFFFSGEACVYVMGEFPVPCGGAIRACVL